MIKVFVCKTQKNLCRNDVNHSGSLKTDVNVDSHCSMLDLSVECKNITDIYHYFQSITCYVHVFIVKATDHSTNFNLIEYMKNVKAT